MDNLWQLHEYINGIQPSNKSQNKKKKLYSQERNAFELNTSSQKNILNNTVIGMVNDFWKKNPLLLNGILHTKSFVIQTFWIIEDRKRSSDCDFHYT